MRRTRTLAFLALCRSTVLSLSSDNRTITSDASGTANGCGLNTTFTVHFVGT